MGPDPDHKKDVSTASFHYLLYLLMTTMFKPRITSGEQIWILDDLDFPGFCNIFVQSCFSWLLCLTHDRTMPSLFYCCRWLLLVGPCRGIFVVITYPPAFMFLTTFPPPSKQSGFPFSSWPPNTLPSSGVSSAPMSPSDIRSKRTPYPTSCWVGSWSPSRWSWYVDAAFEENLQSVDVSPNSRTFCDVAHLRRVPVCPPVSRLETAPRDEVSDARLQGGGQLLVWSRHQPVPDGRGQILHRPSAAQLPGGLQPGVGRHQLQGWRVHGELHLHGGPVSGGRGQVTKEQSGTSS